MQRFFLHLRDHTEQILDPEGQEFSSLHAVRRAVLEAARDIMGHEVKSGGVMDLRYRIDAEDAAGEVVHSLSFKDAVQIIPEAA